MAPTLYLSIRDIQGLLHISYGEAHEIMQMFAAKRKVLIRGRMKRVSVNVFAQYVSSQDGSDPVLLRHQIIDQMSADRK